MMLKKLTDFTPSHNFNHFRVTVALISFLLSVLAVVTDDIINADGILYVNMAEAFLGGGLSASAELYNWPFFAILTALVSKLLFIPIEASANIINIAFYVWLTDILLLISHSFLPTFRHTIVAGLLILSFYTLNEYRDFIIRDVGYWALSFLALWQLLKFERTFLTRYLFSWQIIAIMAILFRVEGTVILATMAMYLLLMPNHSISRKLKYIAIAYSMPVVAALSATFFYVLSSGYSAAFGKLNNILYYADVNAFLSDYQENVQYIADHVMAKIAPDQAPLFYNSGLVGMLTSEIIAGLSIGFIVILLMSFLQKTSAPSSSQSKLLLFFLLINFLILTVFIYQKQFMSTRYCMMAILTLFLLLLPRLSHYILIIWDKRWNTSAVIIVLLLIYSVGDAFHQTSTKTYIKKTAAWSAQSLPAGANVITNDHFIKYYFEQNQGASPIKLNTDISSPKKIMTADYLILISKQKAPFEGFETLELDTLFTISNKNRTATVYEVIRQ